MFLLEEWKTLIEAISACGRSVSLSQRPLPRFLTGLWVGMTYLVLISLIFVPMLSC